MKRVRLTDKLVHSFTCPPGKDQAFLWDSAQPGLGLRVTPASEAGQKRRKAYVFQSRFQGKPIRMTIGNADVWPLESETAEAGDGGTIFTLGARPRARQLQQDLDNGRDPRLVKAEKTAADKKSRERMQAQDVKARVAWAEYLADRKPHWGARHYLDHVRIAQQGGEPRKRSKELTVPGPLAELLELRLADWTDERLKAWAKKEGLARPARARLAHRHLSTFLAWCADEPRYREFVNAEAATSRKVKEPLGEPRKRELVLEKDQLAAWFSAVASIPNPVIAAYLQFMLLNGARPNEPLALRRSDLSFRFRTIKIRDKVDGTRDIPMSPYTEQLLRGIPSCPDPANDWVFWSVSSASGALVDPGDAHDRACDLAGLPRITLQGLRRSYATLSLWTDAPAGVADQIQGHKPQGAREKNYIRRPMDYLRVWGERIERWFLDQAGIKFTPQAKRLHVVGKA